MHTSYTTVATVLTNKQAHNFGVDVGPDHASDGFETDESMVRDHACIRTIS